MSFDSNLNRFDQIPIAIVGMGCRLPGANGLDEYWKLIIEGRSAIGELPASRLNQDLYFDPEIGKLGKSYTRIGALVDDRPLPNRPFRLTSADRANADEAHLELCHVVAEAFEHAGMDPDRLSGLRAGVYVGHTRGTAKNGDLVLHSMAHQAFAMLSQLPDFQAKVGPQQAVIIKAMADDLRQRIPGRNPEGGPFLEASHASRLVSKAFGLDGPFFSLNAACSSTLVALAYAANALQLGQIDAAVVGGASFCKLDSLLLFSKAQSCSANGSRPFDADADGLVPGEGYVACIVKTLDRALADGNPIYGVIRGIGISSDGKGKSLWAPRKEGQVEAFKRAYSAEVSPESVQYIEAHATSTLVGDSTELNALAEILAARMPRGKKVPIGSVKGSIGHTLEPAGLAGLIKTLLAMQHEVIPPTINVERLNPKVDWDNAPFYVARQAERWIAPADGRARRAAISAFGVGGLNAHLVVDQFATLPQRSNTPPPRLIPRASAGDRRLAIVGAGVVAPGARTVEEFWSLVQSGVDARSELASERCQAEWLNLPAGTRLRAGQVQNYEYDWKKHRIPPKSIAQADPLQFMLLDAVDQALSSAGYDAKSLDKKTTGVIVGNVFGGEFASQLQVGLRLPEIRPVLERHLAANHFTPEEIDAISEQFQEVVLQAMPALLDESGSFTSSSLASRITKTFDLMGGACALDSGDTSAIMALDTARNLLLTHTNDLVICAAGQRSLGCSHLDVLLRSQRLHEDGVVLGEGAVVFLLKRLADAQKAGDKIYAIVRDIGVSRHDDLPVALESALERASLSSEVPPEDVALVELSPTGHRESDTTATQLVTNTHRPDTAVGTITHQIGHLGGATGFTALLKSTLALQNLQYPASASGKTASAIPSTRDDGRVFGALSNRGDGMVCHVILEGARRAKHPAAAPPRIASDAAWSIYLRTASTVSDLLAEAELAGLAQSELKPVTDAFPVAEFTVAVVAQTANDAKTKFRQFVEHFEAPARERLFDTLGITFVQRRAATKIALLFPGQGSQYAGMLSDLVSTHEIAQESVKKFDAVLRSLEFPTFHDLTIGQAGQLGNDVFRTQLSLLVAEAILLDVVRSLGVEANCVTAHSYGEFPALYAAGAWDFRTAALATKHRSTAVKQASRVDGAMLSCGVDLPTAKRLCQLAPGEVFIANRNAPNQVVLGGTRAAISRVARAAESQNIRVTPLAVPRPYHTPLMHDAEPAFRQLLASVKLNAPSTPLLSSVDQQFVSDPEEIRENLVHQLTQPVDFVEQCQRLKARGVNLMIEVGPGQVLSQLARRTLSDSSAVFLTTNHRKRTDAESLARLKAALLAHGISPQSQQGSPHPVSSPCSVSSSRRSSPVLPPSALPNASESIISFAADLPILHLQGDSFAMGQQHGRALAHEIRSAVQRRAELAGRPAARVLPSLQQAWDQLTTLFDEQSLEELRGIADGAGVNEEAVIAYNLLSYTDIGVGCTHLAVPQAARGFGSLLHAANEDLPLGRILGDAMRRCVQVRTPAVGIKHLLFSPAGFGLGIIGINAAGISVSSSMLLNLPRRTETSRGLLHGVVVRRILSECHTLDEARKLIQSMPKTGAWALLLVDAQREAAVHVEYDGQRYEARTLDAPTFVTNHARLLAPLQPPHEHSARRLERIEALWQSRDANVPIHQQVQSWLRDKFDTSRGREGRFATMNSLCRVDNQISVVFDSLQGKVYTTSGTQTSSHEHDYHEFDLARLIGLASRKRPAFRVETASGPATDGANGAPWIEPAEFMRLASTRQGNPPEPVAGAICNRFMLRLLPQDPLPAQYPLDAISDGILVIGNNPVCDALRRRAETAGIPFAQVRNSVPTEPALAELERLFQERPWQHLFLLTDWDGETPLPLDWNAWKQIRQQRIVGPYLACQKWYSLVAAADGLTKASITAATRLNGTFGVEGALADPLGGAITGMVKGLALETGRRTERAFHSNLVDFDSQADPDFVADRLLAERCLNTPHNLEIGYCQGRRLLLTPVTIPAEPLPSKPIEPVKVWVVTGGGRGITAEIARGLVQGSGAKLHLIGSSPLPAIDPSWRDLDESQTQALRSSIMKQAVQRKEVPVDAWSRVEKAIEIDRNLRTLRQAGIDVTYHACDVGNPEALAPLLDAIRAQHGPIEGIVHGAGYERSTVFEKKKPELVDRTISAKVDGLMALVQLTQNDPLKFFLGFGSISGRFGGIGQTDYCLANDLLCKIIAWYRQHRPQVHATAYDWHSWDEVGMAVRPETKFAKELARIRHMPVKEGIQHFLNEIRLGCPEAETLITDWRYYKFYFSDERLPSLVPTEPTMKPASTSDSPQTQAQETAKAVVIPGKMRRFVQRMQHPAECPMEAPLPPGKVLLLGNCFEAKELQRKLAAQGRETILIPADAPSRAQAAVQDACREAFPPVLILMTGCELPAERLDKDILWQSRRNRGILAPLVACQSWFEAFLAAQCPPARILACTKMGGDFGFQKIPAAPEGGAITAILKSMRAEALARGGENLRVRTLDFDPQEPSSSIVNHLLRELTLIDEEPEVGFVNGERMVPVSVEMVDAPANPLALQPGMVCVALGGARGITSKAALGLAQRFGLKMHLIGRTPHGDLPPHYYELDEAGLKRLKSELTRSWLAQGSSGHQEWKTIQAKLEVSRTLKRYQELGLEATYHSCDISQPEQLCKTLDRIRQCDGAIHGVIQGAGITDRSRFENKSLAEMNAMLGVKVDATLGMIQLTRQDDLKFFIGFGSLNGRFGANGGVNYSMGAETMTKLIGWYRGQRPEVKSLSFHWHAWGDAGMMTYSGNGLNLALMPAAEGTQFIIDELSFGAPESEVTITDGTYPAKFLDLVTKQTKVKTDHFLLAESATTCEPQIFDELDLSQPGVAVGTMQVDPQRDRFLIEHRLKGRPIFPLVGYLELCCQAARRLRPDLTPWNIEELEVVQPLRMPTDQPVSIRVEAREDEHGIQCEFTSQFRNSKGILLPGQRLHFRCRITSVLPEAEEVSFMPPEVPDAPDIYPPDDSVIYHGPLYRQLTGLRKEGPFMWGRLQSTDPTEFFQPRTFRRPIMPCVLIDGALFTAGVQYWEQDQLAAVIPLSIQRLTLFQTPPSDEPVFARSQLVSIEERSAIYDIILGTSSGTVIGRLEGFKGTIVSLPPNVELSHNKGTVLTD